MKFTRVVIGAMLLQMDGGDVVFLSVLRRAVLGRI